MNKVTVLPVREPGGIPAHVTGDEALSLVKTHYPRPGLMLSTFFQRFQQVVDRLNGRKSFPDYQPACVSCPHCGSALLLHPQQTEQPNGS